MRHHAHSAVVLAALLLADASAGEVYKWVDEAGAVHYTDRPPTAGGAAEPLEVVPAPPPRGAGAEREEKRRRLLRAFEAERNERRAKREAAEAQRAERARKCNKARRDLARLERANLVYLPGEDGGRVYMSDGERERTISQVRAWLEEWCD